MKAKLIACMLGMSIVFTTGTVIPRHEVIVEVREIDGLDRPFDNIVELEQVEDGLAGLFSLFLQELVERALDVVLN